METPFMTVSDYIKWGKLVISWATGENRIGQPVPAIPTTLAQLKEACSQVGIQLTVPSTITSLEVIRQSENLKVLVIPSKEAIEAVEAALEAGQDYPVPPYIKAITGEDLDIPEGRKMDFHAARIGDYTITQCG